MGYSRTIPLSERRVESCNEYVLLNIISINIASVLNLGRQCPHIVAAPYFSESPTSVHNNFKRLP